MGFVGSLGLLYFFFRELLLHLPALFLARHAFQAARKARGPNAEPWVVCIGDNLDEVNGIALASRVQLKELRKQGLPVFLFGVAFHTHTPRTEPPDEAIILAPGRYSVDQAGYSHSELVVVHLDAFLDFLKKYPVDIAEFETPGPVMGLCLIACKILGIQTLSHYRTDIMVYSEMLMKYRFGKWFVQSWTRWATRLAGPVIVPSEAYREKVAAMGVPPHRIHKLPRGVDLGSFHPNMRDRAIFRTWNIPDDGFFLLFVGRISMEKNLLHLGEAFEAALGQNPNLRLILVGDGPYKNELEKKLQPLGRVHFTGILKGEVLSKVFASADLFVFPSLTDTFGNSVVEALASGCPCIVSDRGGPQEILEPGKCGAIFQYQQPQSLQREILKLSTNPEKLAQYRLAARSRAELFSHENAVTAFWKFYQSLFSPSKKT